MLQPLSTCVQNGASVWHVAGTFLTTYGKMVPAVSSHAAPIAMCNRTMTRDQKQWRICKTKQGCICESRATGYSTGSLAFGQLNCRGQRESRCSPLTMQLLVTQQVPQSCLTQGRKERGERLADILCPIRPVGRSVALRAPCCSQGYRILKYRTSCTPTVHPPHTCTCTCACTVVVGLRETVT